MNSPKLRFKEFSGDWKLTSIGECSDSLSYGLNAAAKSFDGENQYIRITDIDDQSRVYNKKNRVSPDCELTDEYLVKENDILFARTGASTGKSYLYKKADGKLYFAGFLIRARIKEEYDTRFVYNNTLTKHYNNWIKVMSMRSGQPGVNSKEYASYSFYLPRIQEQKKISDFFEELDYRIRLQQEKIDMMKEQKKGYKQKIFNRELRFKDDDGREYPDWAQQKLDNFAERVTRKNSDLITTRPLTISAQHGLIDQVEFFNKTVASSNLTGYFLLNNGEFAYNKSYSNGYPLGAIKRLDRYENGALSTLYICFKPKENVNSDFLVHYFNSTQWYKEVSMISVEGARNHGLLNVSVTDFFETLHYLPCLEEQSKIAKFFDSINQKIKLNQQKLKKLQDQKQALMQLMFI